MLEHDGLLGLLHDLQVEGVFQGRKDRRVAPAFIVLSQARSGSLEVEDVLLRKDEWPLGTHSVDELLRQLF